MTTPQPLTNVRLDELIVGIRRASDHPLEQLTSAVLTAEHLGDVADDLIGYFVDQARRAGSSWTDIGKSMGVTKQAAQKRFVSRTSREAEPPQQADGFAMFTPAARNVVVAAQNEANAAGSTQITPAHLILGLLAEPDDATGRAIAQQGVSPERVRAAATAAVPPPSGDVPELVPFDEQSREVLQATFSHAKQAGAEHVGPAHILHALFDVEAGAAVLTTAGLGRAATRRMTTAADQP